MLIDYSDPNNRREFLLDIQPLIQGYVRRQLAPYLDDTMSPGAQMTELDKVLDYLDDKLTIEFKD